MPSTSAVRRWSAHFVSIAFLLLAAGCATVAVAPSGTHLSGEWTLDRAASDDVDARIDAAIHEAQERLRRRRRAETGTDEETFADGAGELRIGPDFHDLRNRLLATLRVPAHMTIAALGAEVRIRADDLPARSYQVGETFSRFDEYGTAIIDTRWKDDAFELSARYAAPEGGSRTERYATDTTGDRLTLTREAEDRTLGRIRLRTVYRRTAPR